MDRTEIYGWYRYSWCCFTHLMGKYPPIVHVIPWINRLIHGCDYLMTLPTNRLYRPYGSRRRLWIPRRRHINVKVFEAILNLSLSDLIKDISAFTSYDKGLYPLRCQFQAVTVSISGRGRGFLNINMSPLSSFFDNYIKSSSIKSSSIKISIQEVQEAKKTK